MVKISEKETSISQLSDEELFQQLKEFGMDVGPIIGSTRRVYERKLERLLEGEPENRSPSQSASDNEDEDLIEHTNSQYTVLNQPTRIPPSPPYRQSPGADDYVVRPRESLNQSAYNRFASSSTTDQRSKEPQKPLSTPPAAKYQDGPLISTASIIKLVIIFILAILLTMIYHNMEETDDSPIPNFN